MPNVSGREASACRSESGQLFLNSSIALAPPVVCDNLELHSRSPGVLIGSLFSTMKKYEQTRNRMTVIKHSPSRWVLPDAIRDERSEQEVSAAGAERFGT
ncbi:MAG: hypothetical protein CME33_27700 [Gimesia sp.]|nr:hypothetical protein [Gimesia sp.]